VPLLGGGRSPAWVVPGLVLAGAGLGIVMVAASAAIISGAPPQRAGMASSIESVSYELGSLAGVTVLGTILTAVYTGTIHLPATAPAQAAGSIDQARAAPGHLPPRHNRPPPPRPSPSPRRPSPLPAGRRRQRLRQRLHPRPGHHRHRPGRRRRLPLPLPQAAVHYPRRTGPAPRTGPARRVAAVARPAQEDEP